jgi:hypothetical protein
MTDRIAHRANAREVGSAVNPQLSRDATHSLFDLKRLRNSRKTDSLRAAKSAESLLLFDAALAAFALLSRQILIIAASQTLAKQR